jgi:hypothetical protein
MKYVLLLYDAQKACNTPLKEEKQRVYDAYMTYTDRLAKSGKMLACEPLEGTSCATTIRVRSGKTIATDGPFAETKEQLGGIYVVDVADLNEAIEWAAGIPAALTGSIEIRPVMDVSKIENIK